MRRLLLREILFLVTLTNIGGISFHLEKEDGCKHEDGDYCHPDCHLDHGGDDDDDDEDVDDDGDDDDDDGDDDDDDGVDGKCSEKYENTNQDSDCAKRPGSVASKPGYSHRNQCCFQKRKPLITL